MRSGSGRTTGRTEHHRHMIHYLLHWEKHRHLENNTGQNNKPTKKIREKQLPPDWTTQKEKAVNNSRTAKQEVVE